MQEYKRWYDHDPLLLEVVNLLKNYQEELKAQAEVFLKMIEEQVSKAALDRFYEMVKPANGTRWYDKDPVISMTVELDEEMSAMCNISLGIEARGIAIGEARGIEKTKTEMITNMLREKVSIDVIAKVAKLTVEQITDIGKKAALL